MSKILNDTIPVLGTLFIAVILMVYLSHIFSKHVAKGFIKAAKSKYITVIDQVMVGQDRGILIIKMQERCFLVGVTSDAMNVITQLTDEECAKINAEAQQEGQADRFKELVLDKFKKTKQ